MFSQIIITISTKRLTLLNQKLLADFYTLQFFKYCWFNNEHYMKSRWVSFEKKFSPTQDIIEMA